MLFSQASLFFYVGANSSVHFTTLVFLFLFFVFNLFLFLLALLITFILSNFFFSVLLLFISRLVGIGA